MIKVFGYLKRRPGLSPQEFAAYYEDSHVPLVLSKAHMPLVYKRNYIQRGDAFNIEGDEIGFDCMTELVFADRDDLLETKRTSSIEPRPGPTWWKSAPVQAERRTSTQPSL
jgi:EthD domain